jgi:plasmid stabilization system protein ParE
MENPKTINWSLLSEKDLESVLQYLKTHWNNQVILRFLDLIEVSIKQIASNPKQFPLANKKLKVRKCVISKHNTLYYREKRKQIEILRLFDTRQHPSKLRLK